MSGKVERVEVESGLFVVTVAVCGNRSGREEMKRAVARMVKAVRAEVRAALAGGEK